MLYIAAQWRWVGLEERPPHWWRGLERERSYVVRGAEQQRGSGNNGGGLGRPPYYWWGRGGGGGGGRTGLEAGGAVCPSRHAHLLTRRIDEVRKAHLKMEHVRRQL